MGWGHVPGGGRGGEESACVRWPCVGGWGVEVGRMSVMQELPARSGRGVLTLERGKGRAAGPPWPPASC